MLEEADREEKRPLLVFYAVDRPVGDALVGVNATASPVIIANSRVAKCNVILRASGCYGG